jgi:superfamily II DNA helicase RecQ
MSLTNLLPKLKSAFGHDKFNSKEQEEAIRTLMKGNEDVLITMPTGRSSGEPVHNQLGLASHKLDL